MRASVQGETVVDIIKQTRLIYENRGFF